MGIFCKSVILYSPPPFKGYEFLNDKFVGMGRIFPENIVDFVQAFKAKNNIMYVILITFVRIVMEIIIMALLIKLVGDYHSKFW